MEIIIFRLCAISRTIVRNIRNKINLLMRESSVNVGHRFIDIHQWIVLVILVSG